MRLLFAVLFSCGLTARVDSQEKKQEPAKATEEQIKRADELKKLIESKKAELAKLEEELAKLPSDTKFKSVKELNLGTIEVGVKGFTRMNGVSPYFFVEEVIDDNYFLAKVSYGRDYDEYVVIKTPTKGFADKQAKNGLDFKEWYVTGTRKIGKSTYFVLEDSAPRK